MDIAALQAFVAVSDLRSFSGAAERIHVTQPAVSKRIAHLEATMDARLFDRVGRQVLLTEAGHALYPHARRILAALEDSRRDLRNLSGRVEGSLSIATSHHIGLHRLPPVLRRYRASFPGVGLDLQFMDSEKAYSAVAGGSVELGIVTLDPRDNGALETRPLWRDRMLAVRAANEPLASDQASRAAYLAESPAILPGPGTFTRRIIDTALAPLGIEPTIELSTNYLETIKMMVSVGLGWSVLPINMLDSDLVRVDLPNLEATRWLGAIHHRGRTLSNAAREMLELLAASRNG